MPQLLQTATRAMGRRGCGLSEARAGFYRLLFDETTLERRRVLREVEQRRLRRAA